MEEQEERSKRLFKQVSDSLPKDIIAGMLSLRTINFHFFISFLLACEIFSITECDEDIGMVTICRV